MKNNRVRLLLYATICILVVIICFIAYFIVKKNNSNNIEETPTNNKEVINNDTNKETDVENKEETPKEEKDKTTKNTEKETPKTSDDNTDDSKKAEDTTPTKETSSSESIQYTISFKQKDASVYSGENVTLEVNTNFDSFSCESTDTVVAQTKVSNNSCIVYGYSYGTTTIKAKSGNKEASINVKVNNKKITSSDFLKVKGTKFVKTSNENTVVLRGFNVGEYLSRAISLTPFSKASYADDAWQREYPDNNVQINYMLTKRFGSTKAFTLNELYYSNFITESDIDKLAASGANAIRLPIEWSYFVDLTFDDSQRDENNNFKYSYTMLNSTQLEKRFKHVDKIIDECGKRGIYVIIDLHVVDGGQNNGGIRSKRGGYTFFKDTNAQNNAIEIWKLISKRYKTNPTVAAYELLNEPGESEPKLVNFYKNAYNAIRNLGDNHIIIMESTMRGATGHSVSSLKKPSEYGFSNVAYSVHDYVTSNNSILPGNTVAGEGTADDVKKAIKAKVDQDVKEIKEYKIPIFIGETNFLWKDVDDVWKYAMSYYDANLISYTFWTYKTAGSTSWGLVYNLDKNKKDKNVDLVNDSYETIYNKFKFTTSTGGYTLNKYFKAIRNNFSGNNGKSLAATTTYNCKVGGKITTTVKSFSNDGSNKLKSITPNNSNVTIKQISPTGVICDGSSCQTVEITCNTKGVTTLTITSTNNRVTTATVNVN